MELFFRKHFWVVTLAFLMVAAFLAAKTVNVLIGSKLASLAPKAETNSSSFHPSVLLPKKTALSNEMVSGITGIPLPVEKAPEEEQLAQLSNQDPVRTSLNVRLLGTALANSPEWSMATLDNGSGPSVFMVGDTVQSAIILEIERKRVIINNSGRKEFIDLGPGLQASTQVPFSSTAHVASAISAAMETSSGIQATSENTYEIPKAEIDGALGNLNNIAMQARVVPAFKNGTATGFKLFSIRPNSLYTKIGLVNGDIIRRINGYEINDPAKALEVYTKLKESTRIEIEIDRNGSSVRKTYNVR